LPSQPHLPRVAWGPLLDAAAATSPRLLLPCVVHLRLAQAHARPRRCGRPERRSSEHGSLAPSRRRRGPGQQRRPCPSVRPLEPTTPHRRTGRPPCPRSSPPLRRTATPPAAPCGLTCQLPELVVPLHWPAAASPLLRSTARAGRRPSSPSSVPPELAVRPSSPS